MILIHYRWAIYVLVLCYVLFYIYVLNNILTFVMTFILGDKPAFNFNF